MQDGQEFRRSSSKSRSGASQSTLRCTALHAAGHLSSRSGTRGFRAEPWQNRPLDAHADRVAPGTFSSVLAPRHLCPMKKPDFGTVASGQVQPKRTRTHDRPLSCSRASAATCGGNLGGRPGELGVPFMGTGYRTGCGEDALVSLQPPTLCSPFASSPPLGVRGRCAEPLARVGWVCEATLTKPLGSLLTQRGEPG